MGRRLAAGGRRRAAACMRSPLRVRALAGALGRRCWRSLRTWVPTSWRWRCRHGAAGGAAQLSGRATHNRRAQAVACGGDDGPPPPPLPADCGLCGERCRHLGAVQLAGGLSGPQPQGFGCVRGCPRAYTCARGPTAVAAEHARSLCTRAPRCYRLRPSAPPLQLLEEFRCGEGISGPLDWLRRTAAYAPTLLRLHNAGRRQLCLAYSLTTRACATTRASCTASAPGRRA